MAEEKVIEINVNATQAEKTLKKFGGTLEDVYGEGVQPLNFAIGELEDRLYEMAAAGQSGTQEFADMAKEVGRMKKVIIDTDLAVDGMAEGIGVNLGGAIQGVAGGFALAQGVMGAFGANSEALEETLLKVQSAMAIADGIQSVREGIKAFKALKVAAMSNVVVQKALNLVMSLNPIGLIIAAVVALGAAIYALWGPIKQFLQFLGIMEEDAIDVAAAHKKITAEYEAQLKAMKALRKQREADHAHEMTLLDKRHKRIIETMEEQGASHEEINDEMRRQTEERFKDESDRLDQVQKDRKEEFNLNRDTLRREQKQYQEAKRQRQDDKAREIKESIEAKKLENEKLLFEIRNHNKQVELLQEDHVDNLDDINDQQRQKEEQDYKERLDRYKTYLDNRLAARKRIEDLELDLIEDSDRQKLEKLKVSFERELEEVKKTVTNKEQQLELENLLTEKYNRERGQILKEVEEQNEDEMMPMREIVEQRKDEIRETSFQKDFEASQKKKKLSEEELANSLEVANAKLQLNSDMLGAVNDLVQAFAKDDEKSARRAFNINKAVGIAQAVISTAQGVINAYANPLDVASGVAFAKSGIIAATGAAQIATIARTEFQGASGGASAPSVTGVPSASAASPTFNVVGDTGVNQLAQSLGQQNKQPVEAYVVAGNVTTAQSLERNKIDNASL